MIFIGLDIGSTTISAVAVDADTHVERDRVTIKHEATIAATQPWEHLQDPNQLAQLGCDIVASLCDRYSDIVGIGLSGQMHGVLYIDAKGIAISPLYTWQDHRGEVPEADGKSLLDDLIPYSCAPIMSGYGLVTHIWNLRHGLVPSQARWLTTISSYVAMRLTGSMKPLLHPSDAAALGFFDMENGCQETEQLKRLGVDTSILPDVMSHQALAGYTAQGIPVCCGLGDNQASFLGSVEDMEHGLLLNIGTGSQVSLMLPHYVNSTVCELRPLIGNKYIAVGSGLCGGRSFALLEEFLRGCAELTGQQFPLLYDQMNRILDEGTDTDLHFDTLFCGTRHDPQRRAAVYNLTPENFKPAHFVRAVLRGIVEELYGYYQELLCLAKRPITHIYCSGNLARLTPRLLPIVEEIFGLPCAMASMAEEAAFGAALYAQSVIGA